MTKDRLNKSAQAHIRKGERRFESKLYLYECMGEFGTPGFTVLRSHLETGETDYPKLPNDFIGKKRPGENKGEKTLYGDGVITQEQLAAFYIATYRLKHSHNIKEYLALCQMYKEVYGRDYQATEV